MIAHSVIKDRLKGLVSPKRYEHILRVADASRELAECHGVSVEQAYLAGLIHDAAKQLTPAIALEKGAVLCDDDIALYETFPKVWHALVAPEICKSFFETSLGS